MSDNIFGKNLNEIILFLNISQAELSKKTGSTCAAISQIINGKREPSLRSICKITKALNINFERLITKESVRK
jgi:transcriptional regulator with XRE-family HTH domain